MNPVLRVRAGAGAGLHALPESPGAWGGRGPSTLWGPLRIKCNLCWEDNGPWRVLLSCLWGIGVVTLPGEDIFLIWAWESYLGGTGPQ